ncbi:hypothetical protein AtEden1_Chr3g0192381 [Arabidopsis thaliana]
MDCLLSSAIEYIWQNGLLPGLLYDRVEVSGWTAELTASLSPTGDRVCWWKCDSLFCFSSF